MITWSLAAGYFPSSYPGWARPTYWLVGAIAALLLFISVLLHELCHSIVAQARGLTVKSITLFIFGGVSNIAQRVRRSAGRVPDRRRRPALQPGAGRAVLARRAGRPERRRPARRAARLPHDRQLDAGVFNILPGFPLDGGRVLRAILWGATGSMVRGTVIASVVGQVVAFLFIGYGIWLIFIDGDFLSGIWIGFIGWFLNSAAEATRRQVQVQEGFRGIKVAA